MPFAFLPVIPLFTARSLCNYKVSYRNTTHRDTCKTQRGESIPCLANTAGHCHACIVKFHDIFGLLATLCYGPGDIVEFVFMVGREGPSSMYLCRSSLLPGVRARIKTDSSHSITKAARTVFKRSVLAVSSLIFLLPWPCQRSP